MVKFKKGDKVRIKDTQDNRDYFYTRNRIGEVVEVHGANENYVYLTAHDWDTQMGHFPSRFELAEPNALYIISVKDAKGDFKPNTTPRVYTSEAQAKNVAALMAEKHPGEEFVIFKAVGKAQIEKPTATVTMFYSSHI